MTTEFTPADGGGGPAVLTLRDSTPQSALALRRALIEDVFTLAIRHTVVSINDGSIEAEELTHRVGLLPVTYLDGRTPPAKKRFIKVEDCTGCDGGGCRACAVRFTLRVVAASDDEVVYSTALVSDSGEATVLAGVPLTVLPRKGDALEMAAVAFLGSAVARHVATCPPAFFTSPFRVTLNPTRRLTEPQIEDLVASCPKGVFEKAPPSLRVADDSVCDRCMECQRKAHDFRDSEDDPWTVSVNLDPTEFRFPIESAGQLDPSAIASEAVEAWKKRLLLSR